MGKKTTNADLFLYYLEKEAGRLRERGYFMFSLWFALTGEKGCPAFPFKDEEFPPHDYDIYGLRREWDNKFKKDVSDILTNNLSDGVDCYFPDDAEKEAAVTFLVGNINDITYENTYIEIDHKEKNSFNLLAIECRLLSEVYANFETYSNVVYPDKFDFFGSLNNLKDDILADCSELISYWSIKDKWSRDSANGGGKSSRKLKYLEKALITKIKSTGDSNAKSLLSWLEAESPLFVEGHEIEVDADNEQVQEDDKPPITYKTVEGYITRIKKILSN